MAWGNRWGTGNLMSARGTGYDAARQQSVRDLSGAMSARGIGVGDSGGLTYGTPASTSGNWLNQQVAADRARGTGGLSTMYSEPSQSATNWANTAAQYVPQPTQGPSRDFTAPTVAYGGRGPSTLPPTMASTQQSLAQAQAQYPGLNLQAYWRADDPSRPLDITVGEAIQRGLFDPARDLAPTATPAATPAPVASAAPVVAPRGLPGVPAPRVELGPVVPTPSARSFGAVAPNSRAPAPVVAPVPVDRRAPFEPPITSRR